MFKKYTLAAWVLPLGFFLSLTTLAEPAPPAASGVELPPATPICAQLVGAPLLVAEVVQALQQAADTDAYWQQPAHLAALLTRLEAMADDGFDPRHYRLREITQAQARIAQGETLDQCAAAGVLRAYVTALRDLRYGRVNPERHQLMWYAEETPRHLSADDLAALARQGLQGDLADAFTAATPSLPQYLHLRSAYQAARASYPSAWTEIPTGPPLLRQGDEEFRIPLLKRRLREGGYLPPVSEGADDAIYAEDMTAAVKAFQRQHSLKVDGVVGPQTIAELNIQPATRLAQLRANLERLRWYAGDREDNMLLVDIAGAEVNYIRSGIVAMAARAQAGQPQRETPPLKSMITHVTLNPTWIVPPTILRKDVLPAVREDIGYLAKKRLRVFDAEGKELDPQQVNWDNPGKIRLRQDSGSEAALGKVAIRFPNPFAVFLHDTPNQKLFATSSRFYSSGCVRVENALTLMELLFDGAPDAVQTRIADTLASGKTRNVSLPTQIPLLMVYWTASANAEGEVSFRPDIYQRDEPLLNLLAK